MANPITSTALSGLQAAKTRANGAASNIANRNTTGRVGEDGIYEGYRELSTSQSAAASGGVSAFNQPVDPGFVLAFDQSDPNASADGTVGVPSGSYAADAVQLAEAQRAYEANLKVLETADQLSQSLLDIDS